MSGWGESPDNDNPKWIGLVIGSLLLLAFMSWIRDNHRYNKELDEYKNHEIARQFERATIR